MLNLAHRKSGKIRDNGKRYCETNFIICILGAQYFPSAFLSKLKLLPKNQDSVGVW